VSGIYEKIFVQIQLIGTVHSKGYLPGEGIFKIILLMTCAVHEKKS
jgi:hypothetical protein